MTSAQIAIMTTIILYLCLVIFTGVMIGKRSKKSAEGFYLGGRGMGPLVTAMSAEASDMSSYLLMGIPGLALSQRCGGRQLDRHRPCHRHLPEFPAGSPPPAALQRGVGRHHHPQLYLQALRGEKAHHYGYRLSHHPGVLRAPMWPPAWRRSVSCSTVCSAGIICSP